MADAAALGIHPPSTVRIDMGGWIQDWPWETVELHGDRVSVRTHLTGDRIGQPSCITYYAYEHAHELEPGVWRFHGREDFTVTAGPPAEPSAN